MKKIIHHLRRQPEEVRRHVLHITIFVVAIIMIMLWIFSLGRSLSNSDTQTKIKQDLQPFSILKDNLVSGYNSTKNTNSSN
ncbi:MAG: hypothetical protein WC447_00290 [Candidatus Paceibacterota bacterium]|jgi:hypothetical protein